MFDRDAICKVIDSHFGGRLVCDNETEENADGDVERPDIPESMLDDLLDEIEATLEELSEEREWPPKAFTAIAVGFVDGVLAYSNGTYSSYEDAYVADMKNEAYSTLDAIVDECSADFDGNRDWGEAAKGYLRQAIEASGASPDDADEDMCRAQVKGFIYGADACEDYEWKIVQTSDDRVVVTDEEALEEFTLRQLSGSKSGGGLLGRVFNALGIDLSELEAAIAGAVEEEELDEEDEAQEA